MLKRACEPYSSDLPNTEREGAKPLLAERAGTSLGLLYQYLPNKAAILFQFQSEGWQRTSKLLRSILEDV